MYILLWQFQYFSISWVWTWHRKNYTWNRIYLFITLENTVVLYNGYWVSFQVVRWPGHGINQPLPSSTEVKERVQPLYSPSGFSWPILGWNLPFPSYGVTKNGNMFHPYKSTSGNQFYKNVNVKTTKGWVYTSYCHMIEISVVYILHITE
jgi:hypothetical protein